MKIGVIGLRFGSQVHVAAFRRDTRCQVVAIAGRNAERAAQTAAELSIHKSCGDWQQLVDDPGLDAVSVAVPPAAQPEIVAAALASGKHVFCEKPLATNAVDAERLWHSATSRRRINGINFIFPELPLWQKARELIYGGQLGTIRHAEVDWHVETYAARTKAASWKNNGSAGGGVLGNFVSHAVYNLEWLFGSIQSVSAKLRGSQGCGETCAQATLDLEDGFPVFLSVASDAFLGHGHRLTIHGEEGTLLLENRTIDYASGFELWLGTRQSGSLMRIAADEPTPGVDGRVAPTARLVSRFVDAIQNDAEMRPSFSDGLRVQRILDKMRASSG
jgi:predicted dehydrogenase